MRTRDTVWWETPAKAATSAIEGRRPSGVWGRAAVAPEVTEAPRRPMDVSGLVIAEPFGGAGPVWWPLLRALTS